MIDEPDLSVREKFAMLRELGFEGVELDSPGGIDMREARAASEETGLLVDGLVDSRHWEVRMTDRDPAQRELARQDLLTAIRDAHTSGGHTVLLVPGHGDDGTRDETWQRATEQIQLALPLAARLGIVIAIENVWNKMFYQHDGPDDQTAEEIAQFVDQFQSPWVGVQFDIGNHQKYGPPAGWIRTLGKRIVKLDIKDWGRTAGFCKIGEGDVQWADVRQALAEISFCGWGAAEVTGGNRAQLKDVAQRMDQVLGQ
jgi:hexulose-6-phosphate isomerase